jgi:hypothetical protein
MWLTLMSPWEAEPVRPAPKRVQKRKSEAAPIPKRFRNL